MSEPAPAEGPQRPALEVAGIVRAHGAAFLARHGASLSTAQRRALADVAVCRTAALGGHVHRCGACGHEAIAYNSCRNRHCPKCQGSKTAAWLRREASFLLPVDYYHVVFTLPPPSPNSCGRISGWVTRCCSGPPGKPCGRLRPTPSIWGHR